MKRSMSLSLCLVAVALVTLGANNSCKAPLDTTGEYSGTWTFNYKEGGTVVDTKDCDCTMTLDQDVTSPWPLNLTLTGTLNVNLSCLDEWEIWPSGLGYPPFEVVEDLYGGTAANSDGRISLDISSSDLDKLNIRGFGESENQAGVEIPEMTSYSGNWNFILSTIPIDGTFDVTRVE